MSVIEYKQEIEVCLVTMPYYNPQLPSLALGLLQSALEKEGIKTRSIYGNLEFCEKIGYEKYNAHHNGSARLPFEEWTFLPAVFPEGNYDEDAFLKNIYGQTNYWNNIDIVAFKKEIKSVRNTATQWVRELAEKILSVSPSVVACSSSFFQKIPSLALLRTIKDLNPDVITLMGGSECETIMGKTIHSQFTWVDYVVSGEGEDLIGPLMKQIFAHGRSIPENSLPIGVFAPVHRELGYPEVEGDKRYWSVAESFNEQDLPNFDDYFDTLKNLPELRKRIHPALPIQASRGCAHGKCRFCGLNAPQIPFRYRPYEEVLNQMNILSERHGVQRIELLGNMLENRYLDTLLPLLIEKGSPYKIFAEIRSNLERKDFEILRRAGFTECQPGIESLHSGALKHMRKGVTAWHNVQTLKWSKQYGIRIKWSILYGLPDDVEVWYEEMADWIPALMHLPPPQGFLKIEYQRNSDYFDKRDQWGLKLRHYPVYDFMYPFDKELVRDLSYTFEDTFEASIDKNPMMKVLFKRKGLDRLMGSVYAWIRDFSSSNPQNLFMKDTEQGILIHDTRHIAKSPLIELTGIKAIIYKMCDKAVKEIDLCVELMASGVPKVDIVDALDFLVEHHLVLKCDGRVIALALEDPVTAYDFIEESPRGWINCEKGCESTTDDSKEVCEEPDELSDVELDDVTGGMNFRDTLKKKGDPILSKDWKNTSSEVQRLGSNEK